MLQFVPSETFLCLDFIGSRSCRVSLFHVSYNNAIRILHKLHMRCSASCMFANAVADSCSTCIRKSMFSLMSRLNTSTNVGLIVQSKVTLKEEMKRFH